VQRKDLEAANIVLRDEFRHYRHSGTRDAELFTSDKVQELSMRVVESRQQLQRDFAEATASMRRELMRLTELIVGCLRKVGNMPIEMENLRQEIHGLRQCSTTQGVGTLVHQEPIAVLQQVAAEPTKSDVSRDEQRELFRTVANVRDLFLSGQHSTCLVLNNLELLRQDVGRLKQGGHLSDGQLRLMREQLWSELRKELKALVDPVVNPTTFSETIPKMYYIGGGEVD